MAEAYAGDVAGAYVGDSWGERLTRADDAAGSCYDATAALILSLFYVCLPGKFLKSTWRIL